MNAAQDIENFYIEVLNNAENVRYGDLHFFYEVLKKNHQSFTEITSQMKQNHGVFQSIDEMEDLANLLLNLINNEFKDMEIKIDFLEYSECFLYYVERIRVHKHILEELSQTSLISSAEILNDLEIEQIQDINYNIGMIIQRLANCPLMDMNPVFIDDVELETKVSHTFYAVADIFLQKYKNHALPRGYILNCTLPKEYTFEKWRALRLVREIISLDYERGIDAETIKGEINYMRNVEPQYMNT
jgi:hypothetical protein